MKITTRIKLISMMTEHKCRASLYICNPCSFHLNRICLTIISLNNYQFFKINYVRTFSTAFYQVKPFYFGAVNHFEYLNVSMLIEFINWCQRTGSHPNMPYNKNYCIIFDSLIKGHCSIIL